VHAPRKQHWIEALLRSRYFIVAAAIHLIIFFLISTIVVFQAFIPKEDFEGGDYLLGDGGAPPPPPPSVQAPVTEPQVEVQMPRSTTEAPEVIAMDIASPDSFTMPVPQVITPNMENAAKRMSNSPSSGPSSSFDARAQGIRDFVGAWGPGGSGSGPQGSGAQTQAQFVCYIAKYEGGDWNASMRMKDGKIYWGGLPGLLKQTNLWSRSRIKAEVIPVPLELASQEIFEKKPPFIYFVGRKDFILSDREIENLRRYLVQGGAIWGDNALAGRGSRFDVAFRREMKRVIPDEDKQFEVLPDTHPIYTKSFFPLKGPPPGMNYYEEPIEAIKMDGDIIVIYTLNNYADMMQMVFVDGTTKVDLEFGPRVHTPNRMWVLRDFYFRNFEPEAVENVFKMGVNIIVHLLTRFQEKLQMAP
jgi:hypothetical protein